MRHTKQYYKDLDLPDGWKWSYYDDGYHTFTKRDKHGYITCKCTDLDIDSNNHIFMMERGLTR